MTNEKHIENLKKLKSFHNGSYGADIDRAVKALEQEPCDDAISRKDAEQMFRNIRSHLKPQDYKSAEEFNTRDLMLLNAEQMIHALPSVTQEPKTDTWSIKDVADTLAKHGLIVEQEPKTGHWEWVQYDYNPKLGNWHCSECRSVVIECVYKNEKAGIPLYKYCPQCGAKMVEPQERSDKE